MSSPAVHPIAAEYDRTVREDIDLFRTQIEALQRGDLTDDQFRAHRLRRGIYGQRQPGVQMIRTKIPGGVATAQQVDVLAEIADTFAAGKAHTTTRQNVQYHFVPLAQVPALLHRLADVRLTTREACYNTVRNVTGDPLAGLRSDEVFDINPYLRRLAFAFLHKELTDNLPRKFKIAFSASPADAMLGPIHDVGIVPVLRDGEKGFRLIVGGGLGPLPTEAQLLDEFLPADRLVNRVEAVVRLFNAHGNRANRNKARLKFVVRERGWEWCREVIEREYADILANGGITMPDEVPEGFGGFESQPQGIGNGALLPVLQSAPNTPQYAEWLETNVEEQKQPGLAVVTVRLDQGNLVSDDLRLLATVARTAGDGKVRFTINQNILLAGIPLARLPQVYALLDTRGLAKSRAGEIDDVTNCPGAYSCNLALTKSMSLGDALRRTVEGHSSPWIRKLRIHISGCPNSCGQHWIGDLGFYGNARKVNGKEIPYYQMLLGGGYDQQGVIRFGLAIQSLPARLVPAAVQRVLAHYDANKLEGETFREYVQRHKVEFFRQLTADLAKPAEIAPELYQDWGDDVAFSLQLGRGECGA